MPSPTAVAAPAPAPAAPAAELVGAVLPPAPLQHPAPVAAADSNRGAAGSLPEGHPASPGLPSQQPLPSSLQVVVVSSGLRLAVQLPTREDGGMCPVTVGWLRQAVSGTAKG